MLGSPDEGGSGAGVFLSEFGEGVTLHVHEGETSLPDVPPILLRISDATGSAVFEVVEPPARSSLHTSDAFLLDSSTNAVRPAIYIWLGKEASLGEKRLAVQYAQQYLYKKQGQGQEDRPVQVAIPVVRMNEGNETEDFLEAISS